MLFSFFKIGWFIFYEYEMHAFCYQNFHIIVTLNSLHYFMWYIMEFYLFLLHVSSTYTSFLDDKKHRRHDWIQLHWASAEILQKDKSPAVLYKRNYDKTFIETSSRLAMKIPHNSQVFKTSWIRMNFHFILVWYYIITNDINITKSYPNLFLLVPNRYTPIWIIPLIMLKIARQYNLLSLRF